MGDFSGEERRRYVRVSADISVRLRLGDSSVTYPAVFARDVSSGGLGVEIGGPYPDSYENLRTWRGPLDVELGLPGGTNVCVKAEVVWGHVHEEGDQKTFRVGLRFVDLEGGTKIKLEDFVKSKVDERFRDEHKPKGRSAPPSGH
jgi:hypothetical protein